MVHLKKRPPILTPVDGVEKLLQLLGGQDPVCKVSVELLEWQFTIIWNTEGTQNYIITIQSSTQSKSFEDLIAAWTAKKNPKHVRNVDNKLRVCWEAAFSAYFAGGQIVVADSVQKKQQQQMNGSVVIC